MIAMTRPTCTNAIRFAKSRIYITCLLLLAGVMLAAGPDPAHAQSSQPGATTKANVKASAKVIRPKNDLLVNRGKRGLWTFRNNKIWQKIDNGNPTDIAIGDLNGDGRDDVIFGLAKPVNRTGTWIRIANNLTRIDPRPARDITAGDFDGDGRADLLATFHGDTGTHLWTNNSPGPPSPFFEVHPNTAIRVGAGDLQGDGIDDAIIALPNGLFVCFDGKAPWIKLNPNPTQNVVSGDFDGDGDDDLVIDRGPPGVWRSTNSGPPWTRINPRNPIVLATGDPGSNGRDDVFAAFPNPNDGIFTSRDGGGIWTRLDPRRPIDIAVGDLDKNPRDDVVAIFPNPNDPNAALQVRRNNAGPFTPLIDPPGPPGGPRQVLFFAAD